MLFCLTLNPAIDSCYRRHGLSLVFVCTFVFFASFTCIMWLWILHTDLHYNFCLNDRIRVIARREDTFIRQQHQTTTINLLSSSLPITEIPISMISPKAIGSERRSILFIDAIFDSSKHLPIDELCFCGIYTAQQFRLWTIFEKKQMLIVKPTLNFFPSKKTFFSIFHSEKWLFHLKRAKYSMNTSYCH